MISISPSSSWFYSARMSTSSTRCFKCWISDRYTGESCKQISSDFMLSFIILFRSYSSCRYSRERLTRREISVGSMLNLIIMMVRSACGGR